MDKSSICWLSTPESGASIAQEVLRYHTWVIDILDNISESRKAPCEWCNSDCHLHAATLEHDVAFSEPMSLNLLSQVMPLLRLSLMLGALIAPSSAFMGRYPTPVARSKQQQRTIPGPGLLMSDEPEASDESQYSDQQAEVRWNLAC